MFVRIARFQAAPSEIERMVEVARESVTNAPEAAAEGGGDEVNATIGRLARRMQVLVDRHKGSILIALSFDSEQEMEEADEVLNEMTAPDAYSGRRTGVETYELVVEETL
jgi:hypothetical protein